MLFVFNAFDRENRGVFFSCVKYCYYIIYGTWECHKPPAYQVNVVKIDNEVMSYQHQTKNAHRLFKSDLRNVMIQL